MVNRSRPSPFPGITRDDPRYQRARARYRAECAARNAPCWLCGRPIDYRLRQRPGRPIDPGTWELDHKERWADAPMLRLEPTNFRPSHMRCNREREHTSNQAVPHQPLGLGAPAQTW